MDDKSALLNQLRIDRGGQSTPSRDGKLWLAGIVTVLAIAAAVAWFWSRPGAVRIHTATAQPIAGAASQGSILDASGYVVARRQATVASKITARMVELDIEEGDHVNAGQIIAKLDDTNIRAALNQASAQLEYAKATLTETQVNLTNAQRNLDDTIVRAPFSGIVTVKAAQPGEMVSPISAGGGFTRTGIGTIVDMDSLEIQVDV